MRKSNKEEYTLDALSSIDSDLVDRHLTKRFELWRKRKSSNKNGIFTFLAATAACFFFLATTILLLLPNGNQQTPGLHHSDLHHSDLSVLSI